MEEVVLSFCMVAVVVEDSGSRFQVAFEAICKFLQITSLPLSRGNHKVNSVENCHWFLNKTQAIAGKYRVSHDIFIQNSKTYKYAWNSAPIDDTNVMCSVADVAR